MERLLIVCKKKLHKKPQAVLLNSVVGGGQGPDLGALCLHAILKNLTLC